MRGDCRRGHARRVRSLPVTDTSTRLSLPCGDVALVADAWGDPDAPTVLLLHGGGQTRHAWGRTAQAVAGRGWRAVAVDLRGHGDSEWSPDGVYGLDRFAEDVRCLLAATASPPVLVGASLGGLASLIALGEPPAVEALGLVLVDVAPRLEENGVDRIRAFMTSAPDGFATLDDAADAVASYLPHRRRPDDLKGLRKNLRPRPDGRWQWHWDPKFIHADDEAPRPNDFADYERLAAVARAITVPTLLVRGGVSDVVSVDGARELKGLIPHAELVDVAGAGHMVAGDRNDRFSSAVLDFLEGHRPA
jgi:pimeloyl-ACP methyl ester carboxylesterase